MWRPRATRARKRISSGNNKLGSLLDRLSVPGTNFSLIQITQKGAWDVKIAAVDRMTASISQARSMLVVLFSYSE